MEVSTLKFIQFYSISNKLDISRVIYLLINHAYKKQVYGNYSTYENNSPKYSNNINELVQKYHAFISVFLLHKSMSI